MPAAENPHAPFLAWLHDWYGSLAPVRLEELVREAGGPDRVAILVVDLLVGFCLEGPLASPRVGALAAPAATFLTAARGAGIRNILSGMDAHPPDSPEFAAFPPHCLRGTREAELIPELEAYPFASDMVRVPKGSLNVGLEDAFQTWLAEHPKIRTWIVIGDCTDLCVYHAAMHLRLRANTLGQELTVCLPADLVATYHLPVEAARNLGALPHDGDLLHQLFLYHLALNGVRVAGSVSV
jgi:nicotinamidase-related amidase